MTRLFITIVMTIAIISGTALAQGTLAERGPFGLGAIFGVPTGISAKYFLDKSNAIDGAIAWDLSGDNDFQIHADYLYHNYSLITVEKGELPVYFGIGGRLKIREHKDDEFGIRFPVGLAYAFADVPIDVFAEVAPILDVVKDTEFDLEGGVGVRFYF